MKSCPYDLRDSQTLTMRPDKNFLAGVIEGFYGQPWSQSERFELFDWMRRWGLNTYLYAPKDDLKHRAIWRQRYSAAEEKPLRALIQACKRRKLRFIYGLSPGLDIGYGKPGDVVALRRRFEQMIALGCQNFSLLFDDIPDHMNPEDLKRWGSLAAAQSHVANAMWKWTRERCPGARLLFCPTPYCGRMAERRHGGEGYLPTLGRELLPEIEVFWTGPEIISREIPVAHVEELQAVLRRKPLIWDNLHANDYDGRRFYCGPYSGRPLELRNVVSGLLINPNNESPLNYVPLRTLGEFVRCQGAWDARKAYLSAMRKWLPNFATIGQVATLEDLVLFGDCHYLPHEEGPEAEALYERARSLVTKIPVEWNPELVAAFRQQATRLRDFCARMTELRHRPLFYALSRRVWELREELDLLNGYVGFRSENPNPNTPFNSDFHLPATYRGGMVARLQRLLLLRANGTLVPQ